ncbi:hypothetical protein [Aneurinibacillus aneurinilyticus]|uniref:hypothetical protein n=1 Tax=Aneurinibacillus aneurinilyticus TaxID=1391 RepID=UPI000424C391|nr:hypothetical protein [Aneurinibacillus aneurinilyticus]MED0705878.1 hypothetical protein [Aneurinibacillus aneurinilyticus]MED0722733.1 hypothetical protein [Aneurinibacillus aneurinilyticus]MED0731433.1 hypothetical protein [Aneurinibacillus aneurinilyticus]MED0740189.1 hypothetical protein [Aneurinibacillus aneurinilyticus]
MGFKDVVIAILSLADLDTFKKNIQEQWEKIKAIVADIQSSNLKKEQENREVMWLWRKCGGIFYGAETTVCAASSYYNASSKSGMGRMRKRTPGAGQATLGAEEAEYEES